MILLALVPLVGTGASFSADEGAAIVQARSLARGDGWIVEHPAPELDGTGVHYPLELSERGSKGQAPFAKHPIYALLLAGADGLGGTTAMVLLSLGGTVAAAGFAAALARRIDTSLSRPAVWVVGLASPLLFDGFLVIAHTLGAAAAAAAVLVAVIALERRSILVAAGVAPCVAAAALFRNEAVFFALGLAIAAVAVTVRAGSRTRIVGVLTATGALVAAAGAHVGETLWIHHIVGSPVSGAAAKAGTGASNFMAERLHSFLLTWLRPSYGGPRQLTLALSTMVFVVGFGAFVARRHPDDRRAVIGACSMAVVLAVFAVTTKPTNIVPGLLVAFPLLLAGLLLVRRPQLQSMTAQLGLGTFAVFALAVLATQYGKGGGGEWGGRYFALGLPVVVPVALVALRDGGRALAPSTRRWAAGSLAAVSVVMAGMGIASVTSTHRLTADVVADIARAGHQVSPHQPVMVTTSAAIPRVVWSTFADQRWLLVDPDDLTAAVHQLTASGVDRFAFVTTALERDEPAMAGLDVVSRQGRRDGIGNQILVLRSHG
jgi:hypothetical protein